MFKNYLTVAIRNLKRHKLYSAINILGLAVGIDGNARPHRTMDHDLL